MGKDRCLWSRRKAAAKDCLKYMNINGSRTPLNVSGSGETRGEPVEEFVTFIVLQINSNEEPSRTVRSNYLKNLVELINKNSFPFFEI